MSETVTPVELPHSRSGLSALDVCETAARRAGDLVLERFRSDIQVSLKGRANVVTDADLASERLILDYVMDEFPDFGILSEESAPVAGASPYTWVVDPIDGTRNFAEGIPHFCIVVAIADGDNVVAGVTYDPVRDELFAAQQGLLAVSPDDAVRDGARAVELAQSVVDEQPALDHLETLAMAMAEAGRFDDAVTWQQRALEAERQAAGGNSPQRLDRLALYRARQPLRAP